MFWFLLIVIVFNMFCFKLTVTELATVMFPLLNVFFNVYICKSSTQWKEVVD